MLRSSNLSVTVSLLKDHWTLRHELIFVVNYAGFFVVCYLFVFLRIKGICGKLTKLLNRNIGLDWTLMWKSLVVWSEQWVAQASAECQAQFQSTLFGILIFWHACENGGINLIKMPRTPLIFYLTLNWNIICRRNIMCLHEADVKLATIN